MSLLLELARHVQEVRQPDWHNLRIEDLCLDSLFASVRLNDSSVGVALNYDLEGDATLTLKQVDETRQFLLGMLAEQPLLWDFLCQPTESLGQMALLVSVMAALSAPILQSNARLAPLGLSAVDGRIPLKSFRHLGAKRVTVVGFGGYLEEALQQDWLTLPAATLTPIIPSSSARIPIRSNSTSRPKWTCSMTTVVKPSV